MKRRRDLTGIALAWLLALGFTLGCDRFGFSAEEREAFLAEGRRVLVDKKCHGCHTVSPVGTPSEAYAVAEYIVSLR